MAVDFTEENVQTLFGHEAAEDEEPTRLREYYFKTDVFEQVNAKVPLRILVGHKGIGKSALFKVAMTELGSQNRVAILIQPNDVAHLGVDNPNFNLTIRSWTEGLCHVIYVKALAAFGYRDTVRAVIQSDPISRLTDAITSSDSGITISDAKQDLALNFLDHPEIVVYIDDLDRGWEGRRDDEMRISALLNAVRDLSNKREGLTFKMALRTDVYHAVRTSDESTDKIEGSVVWHAWTNHDIFLLLIKRIETFLGRAIDESALSERRQYQLAGYLDPVFEPTFHGRGHWSNAPTYTVLMSLIRKRPRDLVKLCTLAARHAHNRGAGTISTEDLTAIFEEYSAGRIQDTINEFRSELPNIGALLMNMKPNKREREARTGYVYNTADLLAKIENIMQNHNFTLAGGGTASRQDLAAFMYKINFLTARKVMPNGEIVRKYFEENRYLSASFTNFGFDWEIHPAYRWALQPEDIASIFDSLHLSKDDDA